MAHAGEGYRIHVKSLTHDERGYPDMAASTHHQLVTHLREKIVQNADEIIRTNGDFLDDARILVISYGCTARSAQRAVKDARAKGIPVGFLRLLSLWPFPEKILKSVAAHVDSIIVAEMNLHATSLHDFL